VCAWRQAQNKTMHPTVIALLLCAAAVGAEGVLAGPGVRERLKTLRLPRGSPPFWLWVTIGLGYYSLFFVILQRLLSLREGSVRAAGLVLSVLLLAANAAWNYLFFRRRNVRAAQLFSFAYSGVAVVLLILLMRTDLVAAALLAIYVGYLIFANYWQHKLWLANR